MSWFSRSSAGAPPKDRARVNIRWMIRRDMPEVLDIERAGFDFPWSEEEFLARLRVRHCIGYVAECGEAIVGFMVYELHKARLDLLDLAVRPDFRRRQVGRQFVDKLTGKLSFIRRTRITLHVRETNLVGQQFLRATGFVATPGDRGHYRDTGEDSIYFDFDLHRAIITEDREC